MQHLVNIKIIAQTGTQIGLLKMTRFKALIAVGQNGKSRDGALVFVVDAVKILKLENRQKHLPKWLSTGYRRVSYVKRRTKFQNLQS